MHTLRAVLTILVLAGPGAAQELVFFPTDNGGVVYADTSVAAVSPTEDRERRLVTLGRTMTCWPQGATYIDAVHIAFRSSVRASVARRQLEPASKQLPEKSTRPTKILRFDVNAEEWTRDR